MQSECYVQQPWGSHLWGLQMNMLYVAVHKGWTKIFTDSGNLCLDLSYTLFR